MPPPARRRIDLKTYLVASLVALVGIAVHVHGAGRVLPQTVAAVMTAGLLDVALRSAMTGVRAFPTGGLISGLIVALLLPDGQPWYTPPAAAALAIGSKHLLRWRGGNVFNPAAFGVAAAVFMFPGQLQFDHASYLEAAPRLYFAQSRLRMEGWSWLLDGGHGWTGSTSTVAVVLLGGYVVYRMRRTGLVAGFLAAYVVLFSAFAIFSGHDLVVRLILEVFAAGVPFFALFMLTDPVTAPRTPRGLAVYGVSTAMLAFAFRFVVNPVQVLLLAILAANVALAVQSERSRAKAPHVATVSLGRTAPTE